MSDRLCQARTHDYKCGRPEGHEGNHLRVPSCPVKGCDLPRKANQMMCRTHWFRVPKELRDRIWRLVRGGISQEYLDSRDEAIAVATIWEPKRPRARPCPVHGVLVAPGGACVLCTGPPKGAADGR